MSVFRRKLAAAFAAVVTMVGLLPAVASAQSERVVAPEDRDVYVSEFHYEADNPPVVDGVGSLTDNEIADIQEKIRQAEASGPPQDEIIPGEMWSDKVGVPEGFDKAEADQAEVAIAREQSQPQARGTQATAQRCKSFWLIPYQVCGEILDRYEQLGGQTSWLLLPIEHQTVNPDGQGYRQRFVGGFIYAHPDTGAHAISPMTAGLWQRHGWEAGWLGYPLGGEVPVEGSTTIDGEVNGWVQEFQGGRVYRTPALEGFQVASINGVIMDKWLELGGPDSELGFPIADEAKTADGVGRFSIFQNGSIYWHPNTGAHFVMGSIYRIWKEEGAESSDFGYPIRDPEKYTENMANQAFEHGELAADLYPAPAELVTDFFAFDSLEQAIEYFEGGSSSISASRVARGFPRLAIRCEFNAHHLHLRTKSNNIGLPPPKVGFKSTLNCRTPTPPERVKMHGWLRYNYWGLWDQAAYETQEFKNIGSAEQSNVEASCIGDTETQFWGTAYVEIVYEGRSYYGQDTTRPDPLPCRIGR